jgi:hypothetical protein
MDAVSEARERVETAETGTGVLADLNYIAESSDKPVYYAYEPPAGTPRSTGKFVAHTVPIRDARQVANVLSLDIQGFRLINHETAVEDFYDQEEVKSVYYPEVERLLKEATGAQKVVIFDHQVRNIALAKRGEKNAREYGKAVHNDYTAKIGTAPRTGSPAGGASRTAPEGSLCRDQRMASDSRADRINTVGPV